MKEATLIFPDQLFEEHPALKMERTVYIAEEFLFFRVQYFHRQRLVLLRASMKAYAKKLTDRGYHVVYIDSDLLQKRGDLFNILAEEGIEHLHLADFSDEWLESDLKAKKLTFYRSPMFLCSKDEIDDFFKGKKKFSMANFYAFQRRRFDILMDGAGPVGGKFSFDVENRKKLPKGLVPPAHYVPKQNAYVKEAIAYIAGEFPQAIGEADPFLYPTTHEEAEKALFDFIEHRLFHFGDYEDAITVNESVLYHSVISPLLNIGLLTPMQVINVTLASWKKLHIPLNSLEGFIRQIIGWREFIRACYHLKGRSMRTSNRLGHKAPIPKGFWDGTTGIPPIDNTIKKVLRTGYCHHIERLMVLGNFLLLNECDPDAVYEWFMGYFVDSYDWVMVPNVYAMSQYADYGSITTKPYISGANYIHKMSDYKKGAWSDLWDGLFWRFISKYRALFEANPRTMVLLSLLTKNASSIDPKIKLANKWLQQSQS